MKIAFTTLGCPAWDLGTIISRAGQYGYSGIDFRGYLGQMDMWKLPEFTSQAAATAKMITDAGLVVSGLSSSARMFNPDAASAEASLEECTRYAEMCRKMNVQVLRVFGGKLNGAPMQKAMEESAAMLEKMAAAAAPVTVAVETHDDWVASGPLAQVVKNVRSANVAVLWDLHHPAALAGESAEQTYANIGQLTCYTHVKDSQPCGDGKRQYCLPGEGTVPLKQIISLLKKGGYDGWWTVEWEKHWLPQLAEPEVAFPAYAKFLAANL